MKKYIIFFLSILTLAYGCNTVSHISDAAVPFAEQPVGPPLESPLLRRAGDLEFSKPNKNFVNILNIGEEALISRIHLIRSARKDIAIQTIIWVNDEVGRYMMYELIQAAKRGVKIQLLIDHIASERNTEIAAFLASVHPNLQIRIYNPIGLDHNSARINPSFFEKILTLFFKFKHLNQRMHNKTFIVDGQIGITGGRNYQNAYFDQARALNYKDRDILITGPVVKDIQESFESYWDSEYSVDLHDLVDVRSRIEKGNFKRWNTRDSFQLHGLFRDIDIRAGQDDIIKTKFVDPLIEVDYAYFIADEPGKKPSGQETPSKITTELARLVSEAKNSLYIQTPYLVLSDPAIDLFKELRKNHPDIDIRISTNSLAATDSWYVYALSYKQKQTYLKQLKFRIYEIKPVPGDMYSLMPGYDQLRNRPLTPSEESTISETSYETADDTKENVKDEVALQKPPKKGDPYFCIHAKSMVIDDEISFIGSYNLDPRSENINTEVGVVIRDKRLAFMLKENIKRDMEPQNSWVIAEKKMLLGLNYPNAILERLSELIPLIDPWPFRYAASFELIEGKDPVDITDVNFYENYRDVGSFPQVFQFDVEKELGARGTKAFLSFIEPLL